MTNLSEWKPVYSGKVRELYIPLSASTLGDADSLLLVATDRISAFDHTLSPDIPGKGALLTNLSRWWFATLADLPHHLRDEEPVESLDGTLDSLYAMRMALERVDDGALKLF